MGQCKICGKPTLGHLLYCRSCYAKLTAEKKAGESSQEKSATSPTPQADLAHPFAVPSKSHLVEPGHCIICGGPTTKGNHFCLDCYRKYARKVVFIKVAECAKFEVLEDSWEGNYTCKDGHVVKSKSEMFIDDYFYGKEYQHAYEAAANLFDGAAEKMIVIKPDFFLPNFKGLGDIYLEHFGLQEVSEDYREKTRFKFDLYRKNGKTVICTYEDDMKSPESALDGKLDPRVFKLNQINFFKDGTF